MYIELDLSVQCVSIYFFNFQACILAVGGSEKRLIVDETTDKGYIYILLFHSEKLIFIKEIYLN